MSFDCVCVCVCVCVCICIVNKSSMLRSVCDVCVHTCCLQEQMELQQQRMILTGLDLRWLDGQPVQPVQCVFGSI